MRMAVVVVRPSGQPRMSPRETIYAQARAVVTSVRARSLGRTGRHDVNGALRRPGNGTAQHDVAASNLEEPTSARMSARGSPPPSY